MSGPPLARPWHQRWLAALKPGSWSKLLLPWFWGQCVGVAHHGGVSLVGFAVGAGFTVLGLAFIVLLNDWCDQRVDRIKRTMFPNECSPKTIHDGLLTARQVWWGGTLTGGGAVAVAALGQAQLGRPGLFASALACMAIFLAYSAPPLKLNYRGGGELLEMVGVGVALPAWNAYCQSQEILGATPFRISRWDGNFRMALVGAALLALSSAVASGLADEMSDRAGGKRTVVTTLGNHRARRIVESCVLAGGGWWMVAAGVSSRWLQPALVAGGLVVLVQLWGLRRASDLAQTNAFVSQRAFKRKLHQTIHRGVLILGGVAILVRVVGPW